MFVTDILLPYTPAKHQEATASCWAFSLCSYWETEMAIASGEDTPTADLSPWYLAHHKIERLCELKVQEPFLPIRRLPVGAQGRTAVAVAQRFGMVDAKDYTIPVKAQRNDYRTMMRIIQALVWLGQLTVIFRKPILRIIGKVIDKYWGAYPQNAALTNHRPIPDITFYTSFNHLPLHTEVVLPMPDNFEGWTFINLTIDELMGKVKSALLNGHSVVWQGHIGKGFSMKKGEAMLPEPITVTDDLRSEDFRKGIITDDHMMHIVGMAHDEQGRQYFVTKNSIGDAGPHHGLIYMEENYVRLNTVAVGL